jgi:type IV secretory pathway TraG/TraD family ATPase VirD4
MIFEKERMQAIAWLVGWAIISLLIVSVLTLAAWPLQMIVVRGFSAASIRDAMGYFQWFFDHSYDKWLPFLVAILWEIPVAYDGHQFVAKAAAWLPTGWSYAQLAALDGPFSEMPGWGLVFAGFSGIMAFCFGASENPFELRFKSQGAARWATERDLRKQKLFANTGLILGAWKHYSIFSPMRWSQRAIRNWECLSVADLAPPGTGKSVQLVANLLADWADTKDILAPSIVVNDPKGELFDATGNWRSQLGPVFKLNWGELSGDSWNPLSPASIPGGEEASKLRQLLLDDLEKIYGTPARAISILVAMLKAMRNSADWQLAAINDPTFAFLGTPAIDPVDREAALKALQGELPERVMKLAWCYDQREQIVDRMCGVLIPDTVEEHWKNTGRAAGAGFILFHMARCDRDGSEPAFGRLLDWLSGVSKSTPDAVVEAVAAAQAGNKGKGGEGQDDEIAKLLELAIAECQAYGYPARVEMELSQLKMKPDRERGSVVSTFDASIGVFKQASVRQKTLTSSFRLVDVRGQGTHNAHTKARLKPGETAPPVTIYVCVRLDSVEAFGRVTGLLFEALAAFLLSQPASEIKKSRPVYLFADEFWTLPPLPSLLLIPAFGRGQRVGLLLIGQSWNQIGLKFGQKGPDMIKSMKNAMSNWVIKTQNSLDDAKELSEMMGNVTHRKRSFSRERGFKLNLSGNSGGMQIGGGNVSEDMIGLPLMRADEVMSMPKLDPTKNERGRQIVVTSGARNTPIPCTPFLWFKEPKLLARVGSKVPFIKRADWFGGAEDAAQTAKSVKAVATNAAANAIKVDALLEKFKTSAKPK